MSILPSVFRRTSQRVSGQGNAKLRVLGTLSVLPVTLALGCTDLSEDGDANGAQAQVGSHGILDSSFPEFRLSPSDLSPFFSPKGRTVLLKTQSWYEGKIRLLALDPSGKLDPKWSKDGRPKDIVLPGEDTGFSAPGWITTVLTEGLDDDGVITISGFFSDERGFVARLKDGEVDTTFHGGVVFFDRHGKRDVRALVDVVGDGQGGTYALVSDDSEGRDKLVYVDRDGNVDTTFGEGGAVSVGRSGPFKNVSIAWDGAGIIVSDRSQRDMLTPCRFNRYTRTGALDESFGDRGEALFEPGEYGDGACELYPAANGGSFFLTDELSRLDEKGQLTSVFSGPRQTNNLVFPLVPFGETAKGNVLYRGSGWYLVNMRPDGSIETNWGTSGRYDARPDQNEQRKLTRARLTPTGAVMVGLTEPNTTIVRRLTP